MTAKSKNNEHIKIIPQPFNYSFTLMFEEYPEQFIEVLKALGKFVKKANTQVKLPEGKLAKWTVRILQTQITKHYLKE